MRAIITTVFVFSAVSLEPPRFRRKSQPLVISIACSIDMRCSLRDYYPLLLRPIRKSAIPQRVGIARVR